MDKAIVIENLTKVYSNNRGVFNINLDVEKGDIFGFLGPNGAGKTTVMKVMSGLMQPDSGDISILGSSVTKSFESAARHIGTIIETAEAYPYLTAYENIKQASRYYENVDEERISHCLELTGILKFKNEKIKKFSLGMKQRLGIAMAIVSNPAVLILDEPLNGLDVDGMLAMRRLIGNLSRDEGTTFFISSHLIHDVELSCTKIGLIHSGRLVAVETMKNILENYSTLENYYISEVGNDAII